ncbi:MAG: hypothetical protein JO111_08535 [Caulobacteraceae bacterium]|nr:hypothetical protein [Caulobacteraceae bacterium]
MVLLIPGVQLKQQAAGAPDPVVQATVGVVGQDVGAQQVGIPDCSP